MSIVSLTRTPWPHTVFAEAVASASWSSSIVAEYRHCLIMVATTWFSWTIKFQIWGLFTEPTWSSAASATNLWSYTQVVDLEDDTPYDGDVWLWTLTTNTDVYFLEANINTATYLNSTITRTAWSVTIKILPYKDEK